MPKALHDVLLPVCACLCRIRACKAPVRTRLLIGLSTGQRARMGERRRHPRLDHLLGHPRLVAGAHVASVADDHLRMEAGNRVRVLECHPRLNHLLGHPQLVAGAHVARVADDHLRMEAGYSVRVLECHPRLNHLLGHPRLVAGAHVARVAGDHLHMVARLYV